MAIASATEAQGKSLGRSCRRVWRCPGVLRPAAPIGPRTMARRPAPPYSPSQRMRWAKALGESVEGRCSNCRKPPAGRVTETRLDPPQNRFQVSTDPRERFCRTAWTNLATRLPELIQACRIGPVAIRARFRSAWRHACAAPFGPSRSAWRTPSAAWRSSAPPWGSLGRAATWFGIRRASGCSWCANGA